MSVNLQIFPQLGAFPGEVGSGNSTSGIGGTWPMQLPLNYWWNYGSVRKSRRIKKTRKPNTRKPNTHKKSKGPKGQIKCRNGSIKMIR
jgi:hypothetical protein